MGAFGLRGCANDPSSTDRHRIPRPRLLVLHPHRRAVRLRARPALAHLPLDLRARDGRRALQREVTGGDVGGVGVGGVAADRRAGEAASLEVRELGEEGAALHVLGVRCLVLLVDQRVRLGVGALEVVEAGALGVELEGG